MKLKNLYITKQVAILCYFYIFIIYSAFVYLFCCFREEFSINTEQVAILAAACIPGVQPSAMDLDKCVDTIKKCWNWDVNRDGEELKILRDVAFAVFDRSAALAAISIAAMVDRTRVRLLFATLFVFLYT